MSRDRVIEIVESANIVLVDTVTGAESQDIIAAFFGDMYFRDEIPSRGRIYRAKIEGEECTVLLTKERRGFGIAVKPAFWYPDDER